MASTELFKSLSQACIKYANTKGVSFVYKQKPLSYEEVFADFGVLPGILKRANKMSSVCLGSTLGGVFPKEERSYLGYKVDIPELSFPVPVAMLFIIDVLELVIGGAESGSKVALDEFSYE